MSKQMSATDRANFVLERIGQMPYFDGDAIIKVLVKEFEDLENHARPDADLRAVVDAAKAALMVSAWELEETEDGGIIAHCVGCYVEREDLENGWDKHADSCVIAEAEAALAKVKP